MANSFFSRTSGFVASLWLALCLAQSAAALGSPVKELACYDERGWQGMAPLVPTGPQKVIAFLRPGDKLNDFTSLPDFYFLIVDCAAGVSAVSDISGDGFRGERAELVLRLGSIGETMTMRSGSIRYWADLIESEFGIPSLVESIPGDACYCENEDLS